MKASKQFAKELALSMFEWQVRFLPMPPQTRQESIKAQRLAYGLKNEDAQTSSHRPAK